MTRDGATVYSFHSRLGDIRPWFDITIGLSIVKLCCSLTHVRFQSQKINLAIQQKQPIYFHSALLSKIWYNIVCIHTVRLHTQEIISYQSVQPARSPISSLAKHEARTNERNKLGTENGDLCATNPLPPPPSPVLPNSLRLTPPFNISSTLLQGWAKVLVRGCEKFLPALA